MNQAGRLGWERGYSEAPSQMHITCYAIRHLTCVEAKCKVSRKEKMREGRHAHLERRSWHEGSTEMGLDGVDSVADRCGSMGAERGEPGHRGRRGNGAAEA